MAEVINVLSRFRFYICITWLTAMKHGTCLKTMCGVHHSEIRRNKSPVFGLWGINTDVTQCQSALLMGCAVSQFFLMINCCKNKDIIEYNIIEMTNHTSANVLNGGHLYLDCRNKEEWCYKTGSIIAKRFWTSKQAFSDKKTFDS